MASLDKKPVDLHLGTDLTGPGHGVTVKDLRLALQGCIVKGSNAARARLRLLPVQAKSHILLTDNPFKFCDLNRIHFALDELERLARYREDT